jgi:polygalacturonase
MPPTRRNILQATGVLLLPHANAEGQQHTAAAAAKVSLVRDFGATGDGKTRDTSALQQAIDRCWVFGGGEVVVPAGNYLTGAIALRCNVTLRLEKDAILSGTPDFADYPVMQVRWEGKWIPGRTALIYALDAEHIAILGPGRSRATRRSAAARRRRIHCAIPRSSSSSGATIFDWKTSPPNTA